MEHGFELDPGEIIVRVIHRHVADVIPTLALALVLAAAAAGLAYMLGLSPGAMPFPPQLMSLLILILTGLAALIFIVGIYVYLGNKLIFTNIHLVHVEQVSLFHRRVSQLNFIQVEDVTGHRSGIFQTIFNYGNVEVQSAAEREKFIFKNAPDPEAVADHALQIHEECVRRSEGNSSPTHPHPVND